MNPDISRRTFSPKDRFTQVLFQQGRPLVDADLNEQGEITSRQVRELASALLGAGCATDPQAFALKPVPALNTPIDFSEVDFTFDDGDMFVDGLFCNNPEKCRYREQRHYESITLGNGAWLVYLEAWEHVVTAVTDRRLADPAFGSTDTAARLNVLFRVRIGSPALPAAIATPQLNADYYGKLCDHLKNRRPARGLAVFDVSPAASELENVLFRVEVQRTDAAGLLTLKVSRSNATTTFRVTDSRVENVGDDKRLVFEFDYRDLEDPNFPSNDRWAELSTRLELERHGVGRLGRVTVLNDHTCAMQCRGLPDDFKADEVYLRPWDAVAEDVPAQPPAANAAHDLGLGLSVRLASPSNAYRPGDYWLVEVRNRPTGQSDVGGGPAKQTGEREPDGPNALVAPIGVLLLETTGNQVRIKDLVTVRPRFDRNPLLKF